MLQSLDAAGVPAAVEYQNWNNNAARNRTGGVKASGALGGSKAFADLLNTAEKLGTPLYFTTNALSFNSENALISRFTDVAVKLSSFPVELDTYAMSTHKVLDGSTPDYVLKADKVAEKAAALAADYAELGAKASYGDAANLLYSDYSADNGNRAALLAAVAGLYESAGDVMMSWPNAYALPYASYVTDVPMASSNLSLGDETVPFYARVLAGRVAFSGDAVNLADEPRAALLYAMETGGDLAFTLAAEGTDELRFSDDSELFACRYADWAEKIVSMYGELTAVRDALGGAGIIRRDTVGDVVTLTYGNGAVLVLNYGASAQESPYGPVAGLDYLIVTGEEAAQ